MKRSELMCSYGYWTSQLQFELFRMVSEYMEKNKLTTKKMAKFLGYRKKCVKEILSGDFMPTIDVFFEISLKFGKIPIIKFEDIHSYIKEHEESPED